MPEKKDATESEGAPATTAPAQGSETISQDSDAALKPPEAVVEPKEGFQPAEAPADPRGSVPAAESSSGVTEPVPVPEEASRASSGVASVPNQPETSSEEEKKTEEEERVPQCQDSPPKSSTQQTEAPAAPSPEVEKSAPTTDSSQTEPAPVPAGRSLTSQSNPAEQIYHIKWIRFGESKLPIVTQSENGPCPLIAILNVLLIRGQVELPSGAEVVSGQDLLVRLGDCILRLAPKELLPAQQADYEANVSEAVGLLPKLATGLDVNVKFTGVDDFEYTKECIVFDLLAIPLYHGWLVDPVQEQETAAAVGSRSYNQLVEFIIVTREAGENSPDPTAPAQAITADQFLQNTMSQLTYHGLCELNRKLRDGELAVFFRNNHFSTILKNRDELFLLVTDQGFLEEGAVVWETLNCVDGDSHFVDAFFHSLPKRLPLSDVPPAPASEEQKRNQIDKDFLMALSLDQEQRAAYGQSSGTASPSSHPTSPPNPSSPATASPTEAAAFDVVESDAALAARLQKEENQRAEEAAAKRTPSERTDERGAGDGPKREERRGSKDRCRIG